MDFCYYFTFFFIFTTYLDVALNDNLLKQCLTHFQAARILCDFNIILEFADFPLLLVLWPSNQAPGTDANFFPAKHCLPLRSSPQHPALPVLPGEH